MSNFKNPSGYFLNSFQGIFLLIKNCKTYIRNIYLNCFAVQSAVFISSTLFDSHNTSLMVDRASVIYLFHKRVNKKRKEAKQGRGHRADKWGNQDLNTNHSAPNMSNTLCCLSYFKLIWLQWWYWWSNWNKDSLSVGLNYSDNWLDDFGCFANWDMTWVLLRKKKKNYISKNAPCSGYRHSPLFLKSVI